jgi:hypothetical protein
MRGADETSADNTCFDLGHSSDLSEDIWLKALKSADERGWAQITF